jgi:phospholipid-transporting ATPase
MKQPLIARATTVHFEERKIDIPRPLGVYFMKNRIDTCKYNALTFLPKNMWEQFHKIANAYFLIVAVLQAIPEITVSEGIPTILLPLFFVLAASAVKDMLEDLKRRKSDTEENNRKTLVRKNNQWVETHWKDVEVGDLLKVEKNHYFPADIILLTSSEANGICYVETKNLDGETNLKHKLANPETQNHFTSEHAFDNPEVSISCEEPNPMIYRFNGVLTIGTQDPIPFTSEQFLLRGSSLKNTGWIVGFAVYTGHETKIMLNSSKSKTKYSALESSMNTQIIYIFFLQLLICLFCAISYAIWYYETESDTEQYLQLDYKLDGTLLQFVVQFLSWMLIFTQFVPISLMVTLEMVKFLQAIFMNVDTRMYYEETDTPARVQSSNLNEELGQVKYVFSDKTGTLTCNIMEFRKFSLAGVSYGTENHVPRTRKISNVDFVDDGFNPRDPISIEFLLHLAVCHTIVTEEGADGKIEYKASSPDELALVNAGCYFGVKFLGRDNMNNLRVDMFGEIILFKVLAIAEFTSARKRMSIVVEMPDGKVKVYCKGADSIILPRLGDNRYVDTTWQHLENYATDGLRTLVLAYKDLSDDEYEEWRREYIAAMSDIQNREQKLEEVFEKIEVGLNLLGATAIEDKLQDGVPETIASLREAGVKVWVLTGDKIETAINIGYSCALITNDMGRLLIDGSSRDEVVQQLHDSLQSVEMKEYTKFALIVAGDSLIRAMHKDNVSIFLKLTRRVNVVLACRVSPQQKADIVKLIRKSRPSARTLSIGDGANDVNMILAAHVGIGISGLEGQQAVRASDFSIAQFKYLKRLMFVHGRESYRKNANLICYNFYKNVLFVMPLFFYGIYSAFSGQILYNQWTSQLFNLLYCCVPIGLYALFDREIEYDVLEREPKHYILGLKGKLFGGTVFWLWILEATLQGFGITLVAVNALCYYTGHEDDGYIDNMWVASAFIYAMVVVFANCKVFSFSYLHYWFTIFLNILSTISYFVTHALITGALPITDWLDNYDGRDSLSQLLKNPNSYMCFFLLLVAGFMMHPIISHCFDLHEARHLPDRRDTRSSIKSSRSVSVAFEINPNLTTDVEYRPRANSAMMYARRKFYFRYWLCL